MTEQCLCEATERNREKDSMEENTFFMECSINSVLTVLTCHSSQMLEFSLSQTCVYI